MRRVRLEFGGIESHKDAMRASLGLRMRDELGADLRYGSRQLRRSPGFTAMAVLTLALGIGANTAIFSVLNTVLLRPLPYAHPEWLVRVYSEFRKFQGGGLRRFWISPPEFMDLRREAKSWESLDAWVNAGVNLAGQAEPVRATASFVNGGMLPSLGVTPFLGRLITPADDNPGAPITADISYGLWQRAFAADPGIVGRDTLLNGRKCTIIGVLPKGFQFPPGEVDPPEDWSSLPIDQPGSRSSHFLCLLGRLKPGVSYRQAQDELDALVKTWGKLDTSRRIRWSGALPEGANWKSEHKSSLAELLWYNIRHAGLRE